MMRAVGCVVLCLLASGCAQAPTVQVKTVKNPEGFQNGVAHGRQLERQRIIEQFDARVTQDITQHCDISVSYLDDHGAISLTTMARAREREMQLKNRCANKMQAARDAYVDAMWRLRRE